MKIKVTRAGSKMTGHPRFLISAICSRFAQTLFSHLRFVRKPMVYLCPITRRFKGHAMTQTHILRIDASARVEGSVTRKLVDRILSRFDGAAITARDLKEGLPLINEAWVNANFTPAADRSAEQVETLALSDQLVAEVKAADMLVIGVPIYNFSVPAALKAWVDQVARAGVTFRYSAEGPVGLLEGKSAIVALASGGTEFDSDIDFAGRYIRHVLGFIGITDVTFIRADRMALDADGTLAAAEQAVDALAA